AGAARRSTARAATRTTIAGRCRRRAGTGMERAAFEPPFLCLDMPRARFRGRAPAVLEEPDQQENDENQGDNAAADVHTSSSFGCSVNDRGARGVTASHDANHELRAGPDGLTLPRGCDLLQRVGRDREVDLAAGGVPHELGVRGATYLRRHDE